MIFVISTSLIKKWENDSLDELTESSKKIVLVFTKKFTHFADQFVAAPTCDWYSVPAYDPQKYNSLDVLFLQAARSMINMKV